MDFLWIDINSSYSHSNLALPSLEAQLTEKQKRMCNWRVVRGTTKSPIEKIVAQALLKPADYIFATAWLFNIDYLLQITGRVAALMPQAQIILGGPEFLGDNSHFLKSHRGIKAVFKGDGEEIFPLFVESLQSGPDSYGWLNLPGFEYIDSQDNYITKEAVTVKEFKLLKSPEESPFFSYDKPFVQIETSRGCFNKCRFCVSGISQEPVQNLPIGSIRERLDHFAGKKIKEIRILDRTFNANQERAIELLELFREFDGILKFHLEVHPALLSQRVLEEIESLPAGLLHIEAGLQSLDDGVITECARIGAPKKALKGIRELLKSRKFQVHTDLIAGLPHYSYQMLISDIKTLMAEMVDEIQLESLKLLPGTHFRRFANEYNLKYSPLPPYEVLSSDSIPYSELLKSKALSKIIEFWYNDSTWRETFSKAVATAPGFLEDITEFLAEGDFIETLYSYEGKSLLLYNFCKRFYPQLCIDITQAWISNGLSLKKEPASGIRCWKYQSGEENPFFEKEIRENHYYYLDKGDERVWFIFNYQQDRVRPVFIGKVNMKNL